MSDYIKREDAERAIEEDFRYACHPYEWMGLEDALDDLSRVLSADVVEVVRCKDCKYNPSNPRSWDDDDIVEHYLWCEFMAIESKYNYCSKGKRSEE